MPHNMMILYFHSPYFHVSNSALFFTLVNSFHIDVVLTHPIEMFMEVSSRPLKSMVINDWKFNQKK